MTFEMAQDIATFVKNNDVVYLNLMGGEFFCNPDWYRIFRVLIEATTFARIVSNGDWANSNTVKAQLLKLKDEFEGKFKISISKDKWHTNANVEKAEEFLKEKNFLYNVAGDGDMTENSIVPVGRAFLSGTMYSMFQCFCHEPDKKYAFLIDEDGDIFKCEFGHFAYSNVHEYMDGGFDARFKEYNQAFYKVFIPNCATCARYCTFLPQEKKEEYGRINQMLREAYVKGATEFCRTIWAQIHVEITKNCVGHYDDENISMATYANKLNSLANFCYEQYHEINEDND